MLKVESCQKSRRNLDVFALPTFVGLLNLIAHAEF